MWAVGSCSWQSELAVGNLRSAVHSYHHKNLRAIGSTRYAVPYTQYQKLNSTKLSDLRSS